MKRKNINQSGDDLRKQRRSRIINKKNENYEKRKSNVDLWVPGGSILYNLACSDHIEGAYAIGTMNNVVGDSSSGKTFLCLTGLAQCAYLSEFDEYDLIYDDTEYANDFDMVKLFGKKAANRIIGPDKEDQFNFSTTIEQFGDFIFERIESEKPFIYVLDSFDGIDSEDEMQKDKDNREKRKKGAQTKGSYDGTKQKKASKLFRQISSSLKKTKSNLIIISQTRDNLNAIGFNTKYRAGGKALKFYSRVEAWLTHIGNIQKTVKGIRYKIGSNTRIKLGKNKFTGKYIDVDFPIYTRYGIDDITSCVDFLTQNGIKPVGIELKDKKKIIEEIDKNKLQKELFSETKECWLNIEKALGSEFDKRPSKF